MELSKEIVETLSRDYAAIYYFCHLPYTVSLSHQAVRALQLIHYQTETTVSAIATHLACTHNTASEIVQRLVEKGLLCKERKGNDERTVVLSLTEQGQQVLHEQAGLDVQRLLACLKFV